MGAYTSVRGWIELTDGMVAEVQEIIRRAPERAEMYGLTTEGALLYSRGWFVPENPVNWTNYIFYGADIRTGAIAYIRDQIEEIACIRREDDGFVDFPEGLLHLDEDGTYEHPPRLWELREGKLHERIRQRAV